MKLQKLLLKRKLAYCFSILLLLLLSGCSKVLHWSRAEPQALRVDAAYEDSVVLALIDPYSREMGAEMNEVIGQCAQQLNKDKPEGTLNNWIADVMKSEAQRFSGKPVDFGVSNYGGIRINTLPQGPVTVGKIFEIMPFDNLLTIIAMPGSDVKVFLDHMASEGGWPISKELRFAIVDSTATEIMINGLPLNPDQTYQVATSDYVANGGDQRHYLQDLPRQTLNYLIRDALITHVKQLTQNGENIVAQKDGRIRVGGR